MELLKCVSNATFSKQKSVVSDGSHKRIGISQYIKIATFVIMSMYDFCKQNHFTLPGMCASNDWNYTCSTSCSMIVQVYSVVSKSVFLYKSVKDEYFIINHESP